MSHSKALYRAGFDFLRLLRGEQYKPSEEDVTRIVEFVCVNPDLPLESLIKVFASASQEETKFKLKAVGF